MAQSEIDAVRALLSSKPRPVGLARKAKTARRGWNCLARCRRRGIHCRRCERYAGRIFHGSR